MDNETLAQQQIKLEYEKLRQARVDIRANIDTETVKGLQLINGGMAAGLVAMLPVLAKDPDYAPLAHFIVGAIALSAFGLAAATVHNRLRRKCNLAHEGHKAKDPYTLVPFRWFASEAGEWRVCTNSVIAMWLSIASFILGASCVVVGFERLENRISARPADAPPAAFAVAPDARVVYDLREKCGNDAQEWFKHQYGPAGPEHSEEGENESNHYSNHYSSHFNRCYALVSTRRYLTLDHKSVTQILNRLWDVNENKRIGSLIQSSADRILGGCEVEQGQCGSAQEWDNLAKPYMEQ